MIPKKITSPGNPLIKEILKLKTSRGRLKSGYVLVEGAREIIVALESGIRLRTSIISPELLSGRANAGKAAERMYSAESVVSVPPDLFTKLSYKKANPDGVLAVCYRPDGGFDFSRLGNDSMLLVIESVEKPGNLGAILRSADGSGISAVIVTGETVDLYNPNVIRSSIGAVFNVPVARLSSTEALRLLEKGGFKIIAASPGGKKKYTEVDMTPPAAILIGSEKLGLSVEYLEKATTHVSIPMLGRSDSLNASAAAAVILYEAVRQRGED